MSVGTRECPWGWLVVASGAVTPSLPSARSTVPWMAEPVIRRATEGDVATLSRLRREFTLEDRPIPSPREDFDGAFEEIVATGLNDGRRRRRRGDRLARFHRPCRQDPATDAGATLDRLLDQRVHKACVSQPRLGRSCARVGEDLGQRGGRRAPHRVAEREERRFLPSPWLRRRRRASGLDEPECIGIT